MKNDLEVLVEKYGTDKFLSGYTTTYWKLFASKREEVKSVLEIGIGSLDNTVVSNFSGIVQHYPEYKQGGSLRVWRDFFPNAQVYGADIAEDCMFEEERISTFLMDSSDSDKCKENLYDKMFDFIIDDGNHDAKYQIKTLENLFPRVNVGGIYVIEDIGGSPSTEELLIDYLDDFNRITNKQKVELKGNHIVIKKLSSTENASPDMTTQVLDRIAEDNDSVFVLQIGAMDGVQFDDMRQHIDKHKWDGLFVEPIPEIYKELVENFKDRTNYKYEQAAITTVNEEVEMINIPIEVIEEQQLNGGYKGMSALYPIKNGFASTLDGDKAVRKEHSQNIKVQGMTLDRLIEKHAVNKIDVFLCDAEGHDWEIFKQLNLDEFQPSFIRLEYVNLTNTEKAALKDKLKRNGYKYIVRTQDIDAFHPDAYDKLVKNEGVTSEASELLSSELTIVSGLWNIGRTDRNFEEQYIPRFKEFLKIPHPMVLFLPEELHNMVWEIRRQENTRIISYELENIATLYKPFWENTQKIRTSEDWLNITGENGWLKSSPQALLEWYNPIVQSKMFMLSDAAIYNTFDTDYLIWLDAGITNTVPATHLAENDCLSKITPYLDSFLFLSYPYESAGEIHGFDFAKLNEKAGEEVKYVCRGGLFGGRKEQIRNASGFYYSLLNDTLHQGYMGTEETIFSLMSYLNRQEYRRYALDGNGLIVKFTQALIDGTVTLEERPETKADYRKIVSDRDVEKMKTNLYVLTFNHPEQLEILTSYLEEQPEWLEKPSLFLLDNSTKKKAIKKNKKIAKKYGFEHVVFNENKGINGGRQFAAEHFHDSDADYMFFFEDDMTLNTSKDTGFCRNGFRKFIPNLYNKIHKVIEREGYDFVKLSFTEVFMDNNIQCSWYNVPQTVREKFWPEYPKLPTTGLDPNAPRTKFNNIKSYDELNYIDGEIYYCNWPMIVSKEGNEKMFIETKWDWPAEQTFMSFMFQEMKKDRIKPAVLLASPITHDRQHFYKPEERREN